jgi:hypothetical protein
MVIHSTGEQIQPSEITAGMWLSRISDKERDIFGVKLTYFGCVVRDISLIENIMYINFQSAVGYDEDEQPEDIDVGAIDYQYLTVDECDFFR